MASSEFAGIDVNYYWRIQSTLPYTSGLPGDVSVNTWHFVGEGPTDYTLAFGWLGAFYDAIGDQISTICSRTADAVTHEVYDLSRARPNPPVASTTDTLVARATGYYNFPPEVSLVGSFQAAPVAGQIQARRRGRLYLPPLAVDGNLTDYARPSTSLVNSVVAAFQALFDSSEGSSLCRWAQWSPTNAGGWMIPGQSGPPNLPAGVSPIHDGWVDNEWDTQRRRSAEATSRTTFS